MKLVHALIFVALLIWGSTTLALSARTEIGFTPTYPYYDWLENVPDWIGVFAQFDGVHYITIARQGYAHLGLVQAFFPVYPLLMKFIAIDHSRFAYVIVAGRVVSIACLFAITLLWFKQSVFVPDKKSLGMSLAVFLLWPVSFFLFSVYTESLFILLVIGSFLLAQKKQWLLAGVLAGYASGTKIIGVLLFPALLIELAQQTNYRYQNTWSWVKKHSQSLLFICLSLVGWLAYSLYLFKTFGDPFLYFNVQQDFGGGRQESVVLLPQVVVRYVKMLSSVELSASWLIIAQELFLSGIAFTVLVVGWRKVQFSVWMFSLLALIIPTLTGTFSSMPRYILSAPAVFLLLGQYAHQYRWVYMASIGLSLILLCFNLWLYGQGLWVS